jgi:CBS domain-containing protein
MVLAHFNVGLIPVCDGDKLRGTITDRDITVRGVAEGFDPSKTKVADISQQISPTVTKTMISMLHWISWKKDKSGDCQ